MKKVKFKRVLSCLLAIIFLMTLLPVFPVNAEELSNSRLFTYDDYTIEYTVNNSWENRQSIKIKITNTGTEPILSWVVKYNAGGTISELSNAAVYKQTDNVYILKNAGYNYEIQPNQSASFSYVVTGQNLAIPEQMKLISERIEKQDGFDVQYVVDDWATSFQANVTITNSTDMPIEAWALSFHGNFTIVNVWNSRLVSSNENSYTIASQAWANPIPANASLTFSFTGSKSAASEVELTDFVLTEIIISDELDRPDDGIIDQGDIEDLISLGQIEVIRGEDGSFRMIDGTFTNQRVHSINDAANVLNSASSLFGSAFSVDASEITHQCLEGDGEASKENIYRCSPLVNGIPILGSQLVLIVNENGIVQSLFSTYNNRVNNVDTHPTITEQEAVDAAIEKLLSEERIVDFLQQVTESSGYDYDVVKNEFLSILGTDAQMLVYAVSDKDTPALAWAVELNTYSDLGNEEINTVQGTSSLSASTTSELPVLPFISETVYIYANGDSAGTILTTVSNIQGWSSVTLEADDLCDNSRTFEAQEENGQYRLRDAGRDIETYKTTYGGLLWLKPQLPGELVEFTDVPSASAVSAHANIEAVYDFYKDTLNRDSFDGRGAKIISSIDCDSNSWLWGDYKNAAWTGTQIIFGNEGNYEAALDVVGHELTHAVIRHISGGDNASILYYSGESGALNEAYADIMGSLIENKSGDNRWLLAEDADAAIRNMANPSQYNQPEHYANRYTGTDDNGGVHINSGIFNFAAYKMITDSRTSSISNATWAKVFYHSLSRLTTNSMFLDARGAVISTAKSLGFSQSQQQAIKDAFDEVGIKELDSIRIVLRWGDQPYDLDSHLVGPAVSGSGKFHIYYSQRSYYQNGSYSSEKALYAADLDYDDTSSYGPEITTIHTLTPGDYYFYVHDYSNRGASASTALANSEANVTVYSGSSAIPIETFEIDASSDGTLWNVFKLTIGSQGELSFAPVDEYSYHSNPSSIGS